MPANSTPRRPSSSWAAAASAPRVAELNPKNPPAFGERVSLEIDAERALALPIRPLLASLAERVAVREARRGQPVTRVTVEAWSAALSDDGSQADAHRLAAYTYDVIPGRP